MREVLAYTPEFDSARYKELNFTSEEVRLEKEAQLESYVQKQVETLLGERFNVLLSSFNYEVKDGKLFGENMDEPALESFKKGRDHRRIVGNQFDFEREDAEIVGFSKVQEKLGNAETPTGTMLLSISPKGSEESIYQHNFYDIFTKKDDLIETRRYSSALDIDSYKERLGISGDLKDADFLSNPIDVTSFFDNAEEVHEYLHIDHEYTSEEVFRNKILKDAAPFIVNYAKSLDFLSLNAVLNVADESERRSRDESYSKITFSNDAVFEYGMQEVRRVAAGCGSSGGFSLSKGEIKYPFSVSTFAIDSDEKFTCPNCSKTADGPVGNKCPNCKITKEEYARKAKGATC